MAILSNELRIGNLIYIDNGEKPRYEYEVTAHDIEEVEGNGEDCFPIPLSPEWLERAGFEKTGRYAIGSGGYITYKLGKVELLQVSKGGTYTIPFYEPKIKYVHQLQNIYYYLSGGEELTFKPAPNE